MLTPGGSMTGLREDRERPLIMSAPMVRAILAGRKTQTRRILKPQPNRLNGGLPLNNGRGAVSTEAGWKRYPFRVGDRLWVKEAHMFVGGGDPGLLLYRATWLADAKAHGCENLPAEEPKGWRSPLFMARALSRLTLIVESVRVERLQDISEADAQAEGAIVQMEAGLLPNRPHEAFPVESHCGAFKRLWNSIHGPDAWDANPWVAVIGFRAIHANIDATHTPTPDRKDLSGQSVSLSPSQGQSANAQATKREPASLTPES